MNSLLISSEDEMHQQNAQPQTLEEYNQDIDDAIAAFERGEFITSNELKKLSAKW